jgi:hypothetical protein
MFNHKWFFQGKVIEINDGQTFTLWIDLGFETWKKILVRFNRLRIKEFPGITENTQVFKYLEQNLKGKKIYCQIFKTKGQNKIDRFFAEIYVHPGDIPLKLKDINKSIADTHRIDGLINFNDLMVNQDFATYIDFHNRDNDVKISLCDRPARQHSNVRNDSGQSPQCEHQTNSSRG